MAMPVVKPIWFNRPPRTTSSNCRAYSPGAKPRLRTRSSQACSRRQPRGERPTRQADETSKGHGPLRPRTVQSHPRERDAPTHATAQPAALSATNFGILRVREPTAKLSPKPSASNPGDRSRAGRVPTSQADALPILIGRGPNGPLTHRRDVRPSTDKGHSLQAAPRTAQARRARPKSESRKDHSTAAIAPPRWETDRLATPENSPLPALPIRLMPSDPLNFRQANRRRTDGVVHSGSSWRDPHVARTRRLLCRSRSDRVAIARPAGQALTWAGRANAAGCCSRSAM